MLQETQRTSAPSSAKRLDQDGGLDRHVEGAHDPGAGERVLARVALAQRHQAGHLLLGEADLLAAELGQRQILHLEGLAAGLHRRVECVLFLYCYGHLLSSVLVQG